MERLSASKTQGWDALATRERRIVLREDSKKKKYIKKIKRQDRELGWHPGPWDTTLKEGLKFGITLEMGKIPCSSAAHPSYTKQCNKSQLFDAKEMNSV